MGFNENDFLVVIPDQYLKSHDNAPEPGEQKNKKNKMEYKYW
jgi:hypothetical protein